MKRHFFCCAALVLIACPAIFAVPNDYINGYLKGYEDGKAGKEAQYTSLPAAPLPDSGLHIEYFVDEFGDPTANGYISQKRMAKGTFSNSATTNSNITWYIAVAPNEQISFVIFEYERTRLAGSYGYPDKYMVSVKTEDGRTLRLNGKNSSDRITLDKDDANTLLAELLKDQTLKISIREISKYSTSSYNLGTLNAAGFSELYNQLISQ